MPSPDFETIAGGVLAVVQQGVPGLRKSTDFEPSRSINYGSLPYATVFMGPTRRPGVEQPKGEISGRYFTTVEWVVRVYLRLVEGGQAQHDHRAAVRGILDAWDTYPLLNAPPGGVPIVQDSAVIRTDHTIMGDADNPNNAKPVWVVLANVETFTIA